MAKRGEAAETRQAKEQLQQAVESLLPPGISLDAQATDVERRIRGYLDDVKGIGRAKVNKVTRLLEAIQKSRNSN